MNSTVKSTWDFDETIRGTIKGAPVALDLAALAEEKEQQVGILNDKLSNCSPWIAPRAPRPSSCVQVLRWTRRMGESFSVNTTLGRG